MSASRFISMTALATLAVAASFNVQTALAQKSKDTMRMPLVRQISVLDPFMETGSSNRFVADTIHDELICYNEDTKKLDPLLAKSFRQVDDKTLEFVMRDDVKWQDGEKFSADDVVYFLSWASGPDSKLRFKETWAWIDKVEKTGPDTVRITAKDVAPYYMMRMAFETWIYPQHIHAKLADPRDYGKNPVGTGPYKATKVDKNGIDLAKNPYFQHGGDCKQTSNIGNVQIRLVPDISTQIAGYIAGEWDVLVDVNDDQARDLAQDPRFIAESNPVMAWIFATLDANNVSGNSPFKDKRVRQAFFAAVDRKEIAKLFWGKDQISSSTDNLCFRYMAGCDYTDNAIKYDPALAKRLLAEAGYPDGVDVELSSVINTSVGDYAKVMQAQVAKVGFRMKLDLRAFNNYLDKESKGQTMIRNSMHSPRLPDVSGMTRYFFEPGAARNAYYNDPKAIELAQASEKEMDPTKRKALIKQLSDYNADQAYVLPIVSSVVKFTHTSDILVNPRGRLELFGFYMSDLNWKK